MQPPSIRSLVSLAKLASAKSSQAIVATEIGVGPSVFSRWLTGETVPTGRNLALLHAWAERKAERGEAPGLARDEAPSYIPRVAAGLSKAVRVWLQKFLLELAKAGVSQEEIDAVRVSMTSPEHFTIHFAGDRATESSDAEVLRVLEGYADMYRGSLRRKGYKL